MIGGNKGPEKIRRAALALAEKFVETLDRGERVAPMLAPWLREQATEDSLDAMFNGFRSWTGAFEKCSPTGQVELNDVTGGREKGLLNFLSATRLLSKNRSKSSSA